MDWLPQHWDHPHRVELSTGHHLRPIRAADVDLDMPAVMGSQARLWAMFGDAWGWPPPDMTKEADEVDLARHEREAEAHESFNYALFDEAETELIGCVYIDPPERDGYDAQICWWVRDAYANGPVEAALDAFVPSWIEADWPLRRPYLGPP